MKTSNLIKLLSVALAVFVLNPVVARAHDDCGENDRYCCIVENSASTGSRTLDSYINGFNATSGRSCSEKIVFDNSVLAGGVTVTSSYTLNNDSTEGSDFFIGNSDAAAATELNVEGVLSNTFLFTVDGVEKIHIRNLNINGDASKFVKCTGNAHSLEIDGVTINNAVPDASNIEIDGCQNVKINGLEVSSLTTKSGVPFIAVKNASDEFELAASQFSNVQGPVVQVDSSNGYSISGLDVTYRTTAVKTTTDPAAPDAVIEINQSSGLLSDITVTNATDAGIVFNNLDAQRGEDTTITAPIVLSAQSTDSLSGLLINNSNGLRVSGSIEISGFAGPAVLIAGTSNDNSVTGSDVYLHGNGAQGVVIQDSAANNTINGITVNYNLGCGVELTSVSPNSVDSNNLAFNDSCVIGGASDSTYVQAVNTTAFTVAPLADGKILFDYDRDALNLSGVDEVELHQVITPYTGGAESSQRRAQALSALTPDRFVSQFIQAKPRVERATAFTRDAANRRVSSLSPLVPASVLAQAQVNDAVFYSPAPPSTGSNSLLYTGSLAGLPLTGEDNVQANVDGNTFFVILKKNGYVVGTWSGVATTSGNDLSGASNSTCASDTTLSGSDAQACRDYLANCHQDENGGLTLICDSEEVNKDKDGDGLNDCTEDANQNCVADAGETKAYAFDSDNDNLSDGVEVNSGGYEDPLDSDSDNDTILDGYEDENGNGRKDDNEPYVSNADAELSQDSDSDGIADGSEDANHNGVLDAGETDPAYEDTDGDLFNDSEDKCPTDERNTCTAYEGCVAVSPEDYAAGTFSLSASAYEDEDEDGRYNGEEDANHDCVRQSTETDAKNADTDADGLNDYTEVTTCGTTDPLNSDSDGDEIKDGLEDKDGNCDIDLNANETDPAKTDTDGDGISDGVEDIDHDGVKDTSGECETSASLADTDNDGVDDYNDMSPFDRDFTDDGYRYMGSGCDQDTDKDGLNDKEEDKNGNGVVDAGECNPHSIDTDNDHLTDNLEALYETNCSVADTDGDGRTDGSEVGVPSTYEDVGNYENLITTPVNGVSGISTGISAAEYNAGLSSSGAYDLTVNPASDGVVTNQADETDPTVAQGNGCSLNTSSNATSASSLPITLIAALLIPLLWARTRSKMI